MNSAKNDLKTPQIPRISWMRFFKKSVKSVESVAFLFFFHRLACALALRPASE
jgi:hypothetical protein